MNPIKNDGKTLPFTASLPQPDSRSFLEKVWEKICAIAKSIFSTIVKFFSPKEYFSKREITLLRDERPAKTVPLTPLTNTRRITVEKPATDNSLLSNEKPVINPEPVYNTFDEPLEELRAFTRDFSALGVDIFYENLIDEQIKSAQTYAPSLPPVIKSLAKLLIEMGDKAAKPLFKKFAEQKTQIIEPALKKIFKTLLKPDQNELRDKLSLHLNGWLASKTIDETCTAFDYIKPILSWISTPEEQRKSLIELYPPNKKFDQKLIAQLSEAAQIFWIEQTGAEKGKLYSVLEKKLIVEFKDTKVPTGQKIDQDFIKPILEWLFYHDQSIPLNDSFGVIDSHKEMLIDRVFERVITLLVEKKIDQYSSYLEKKLERDLGEIILQMMQKNATRITDFFTERASELISNMPFTDTFDTVAHDTLAAQIQGIISSEAALEEEKQLLEKAKVHAQIVSDTPESLDAKIRAKNHLKTVEMYGGEEAYLHYMRLENFSKQKGCNPQLKQIIEQEIQLIKLGKDPILVRSASEKAIYATIAENLLNLMTPTRKKLGEHGEVEETDPFVELWDRLYFPEEFYDLIKQSEDLTHEFVTPETTALLEKIKLPLIEIVKNLFKSSAKDLLKKHIGEIVQKGFEKLIVPNNINEINAENSLPNINLILVETFSKQELARNLNEFAPLFCKLVTSDDAERDLQLRTIQNALIKLTKSKFQQFNPDQFYSQEQENETDHTLEMKISGLTPIDWINLTQGIVLEVEKNIRESKINNRLFDPAATSLAEIKEILKATFSSDFKANNPRFGTLSMDLIFKLGEMSNEGLISFFLQDNISRSITEAVEPWRESPQKLVETTTKALKRNYLDRDAVKSLLLNEPAKPSVLTERKLAHQIDIMARLSHDIIMGLAQENGMITTFATRQVLSDNPDKLNQVITRVYKKLFEDQLINQNLAVNACDKIVHSLFAASDQVRARENIEAHQMAAKFAFQQAESQIAVEVI